MPPFCVNASAPEGLSPFSRQVFEVVVKYTVFAWPILTAQCRRAGVDPTRLEQESLLKVISFIAERVGAFTSPEKATLVAADLSHLARVQSTGFPG
jgi:hypothetical protein